MTAWYRLNGVMEETEQKSTEQSGKGGEAANRLQAPNTNLPPIAPDRIAEPARIMRQPPVERTQHIHDHAPLAKMQHAQRGMHDTRKPPLLHQQLVESTIPLLAKRRHLRATAGVVILLSLPFYHIERDTARRTIIKAGEGTIQLRNTVQKQPEVSRILRSIPRRFERLPESGDHIKR